jgi:hypothetical protein
MMRRVVINAAGVCAVIELDAANFLFLLVVVGGETCGIMPTKDGSAAHDQFPHNNVDGFGASVLRAGGQIIHDLDVTKTACPSIGS